MPNNPASSYANSIDPAGGIQQPHAKTELSGHDRPIEVKTDFNAGASATDQAKAQQVNAIPSEQVANTNLGLGKGPVFKDPMGQIVDNGVHRGRMDHDGKRVVDGLDAAIKQAHLGAIGRQAYKQKLKSPLVSPEAIKKAKTTIAREALKSEFTTRAQEARAEQRQSLGRTQGRSV